MHARAFLEKLEPVLLVLVEYCLTVVDVFDQLIVRAVETNHSSMKTRLVWRSGAGRAWNDLTIKELHVIIVEFLAGMHHTMPMTLQKVALGERHFTDCNVERRVRG